VTFQRRLAVLLALTASFVACDSGTVRKAASSSAASTNASATSQKSPAGASAPAGSVPTAASATARSAADSTSTTFPATQPTAAVGATTAPISGTVDLSHVRRNGKTLRDSTAIIRALYVNRFAAQSSRKFAKLIGFADATEVNALVIDMKDEFGLNWHSSDPEVSRNAGSTGKIRNVRAMLDTLKAHGIMPIARLVTFKDSVAARANPTETIRKNDGSPWHDRQGLAWVNPYSKRIQEYNLRAAEELVRLGFEEVQWDYIRFPEPYASLPAQVFPSSEGVSKPDAIAAFLAKARTRLNALGVRSTADVFGLTTTVTGPLEVAQHWERVAPVTDVLLPMVYPSHYPRGSLGVANPNADPYAIVFKAISSARKRTEKLGLHGQRVRPWLQAFTLGKPPYDAEQLRQQIKAVYDAGYEGWVLWNAGSNFDVFIPALAKTLEPHARSN
jgi:hypothetical protein